MWWSGPVLSFVIICTPLISYGAVLINEIAWMGTAESFRCEWIELYNDGGETVDISEWKLKIGDDGTERVLGTAGTPLLVPAGGYFVIERLVPSCPDPVPESSGLVLAFGDIPNASTTIYLLRPNGTEDQVGSNGGWEEGIGGNNETKDTAQRTQSGWITGTPTPGVFNVQTATTIEDEDESTENATSTTQSSGSSGGSTSKSKKVTAKAVTIDAEDRVLTLTLHAPNTAFVGQPVAFEVVPTGAGKTILNSLVYRWNFGDTYISNVRMPTHTFAYAGEYIVIVEALFAKQKARIRHDITVLPLNLSLAFNERGDVLLHNNALYESDVSGYHIAGSKSFIFPPNTLLGQRATLTISHNRVGDGAISLYDSERTFMTSTEVPDETALIHAELSSPILSASISETPLNPGVSETDTDDDDNKFLGTETVVIGDNKVKDSTSHTPQEVEKWRIIVGVLCIGGILTLYLRRSGT